MTNPKILIGIVLALIIVGIWSGDRDQEKSEPTDSHPVTATAAAPVPRNHPNASLSDPPVVSPQEGRAEEEHEPVASEEASPAEDPQQEPTEDEQRAAIDTAQRFIQGWLIEDSARRQPELSPLAAPELVEGLSGDIRVWSAQPTGEPTIKELAPGTAILHQRFNDGREIELLLAVDVARDTGWIVQDVLPVSS